MGYEINVSLNGQHYFATHTRSLTVKEKAVKMAQDFEKLFPTSEGYKVDLSEIRTTSQRVDIKGVL